ncbi:MAG: nitronate monooxygenase [Acidimicrobiia bacterium]|nr:nitronate monooxygenase [Acidimicrobiia bacterium]
MHTRFCDLVGVEVPIVQTGMGWVSGVNLTSATSAAGALGILAAATMSLPELRRAISGVRERTDRPFGVNLRADAPDIDERVRLLIDEEVRVASFAQAPKPEVVERLRTAGVVCMPTVGAPRHAEKVAAWGVDAVIAQGAEGGGHTGTIPTSLLIPQVVDAVDVPVVAAGGFLDGRGLVAALAWGAAGVAMGTRFLLSAESRVPQEVKERYLAAKLVDTVVTRAVDGYPQRVIRTEQIDRLEDTSPPARLVGAVRNAAAFRRLSGTTWSALVREGWAMRRRGDLTNAQVLMAANAPMMIKAALVDGNVDAGVLPTGQVVGAIDSLPTVAEIVSAIAEEATSTLDRLAGRAS